MELNNLYPIDRADISEKTIVMRHTGEIINKMDTYPVSAGFLFPNREFYPTNGEGHKKLADRLLKVKFHVKDTNKLHDSEYTLQSDYFALLVRHLNGEKLVYLPKVAPSSFEGRKYFKDAIKFYKENGFKVLNLYKISLSIDDYYFIKNYCIEDFESAQKITGTVIKNYTNTVISTLSGRLVYNPERIGD